MILVVGDVIEDKYIYVDINRVCPEAPCLVARDKRLFESRLGGAANVANNIASLGEQVSLVGCFDEEFENLVKNENDIITMYRCDSETNRKIRFVDDKSKIMVLRHDTNEFHYDVNSLDVFRCMREAKNKSDDPIRVQVLVDYLKGTISSAIGNIGGVEINIVSTKDPSPRKFLLSTATNILVLNDLENGQLEDWTGFDYLIVTCGAKGLLVFDKYGKTMGRVDGHKVPVFDVTGAGDTVVAALAWRLNNFGTFSESLLLQACEFANYCAAQVVARPGTAVATKKDAIMFLKK